MELSPKNYWKLLLRIFEVLQIKLVEIRHVVSEIFDPPNIAIFHFRKICLVTVSQNSSSSKNFAYA